MNGLRKRLNICGTLYALWGLGDRDVQMKKVSTGESLHYFRRDLSHSSGRQTGARRWICNERKDKWGDVEGLAWAFGCQDGTGGELVMGRRGPRTCLPPFCGSQYTLEWRLGDLGVKGRRCVDFLAHCGAQHNYWDCIIILLFDSDLPSTGSLWKTWVPAGRFGGSDCIHRVQT